MGFGANNNLAMKRRKPDPTEDSHIRIFHLKRLKQSDIRHRATVWISNFDRQTIFNHLLNANCLRFGGQNGEGAIFCALLPLLLSIYQFTRVALKMTQSNCNKLCCMKNGDQNECGSRRVRKRIYFDSNSSVYEYGNEMMQIFLISMK